MFYEPLGPLRRQDLDELGTPHAQDVIDEPFEFLRRRHRQMSFEDDTIKTMQDANNEAGKLDQKRPY